MLELELYFQDFELFFFKGFSILTTLHFLGLHKAPVITLKDRIEVIHFLRALLSLS